MSEPEIGRGVGHNIDSVPLAEQITGELAEEQRRADELLQQAAAARLDSAVDAGMVADLIVMLRFLERALEAKRDKRKQPYQLDMRIIDSTFAALITPLTHARVGPGSLQERLTAWQKEHPDVAPITSIAAVGSRRKPNCWINDLGLTVAWLVDNYPDAMTQAARNILGPLVRQAGVDAAESLEIPGVRIEVESSASVR